MCLFYFDDIIVFSSTWEEHLARLLQDFERLRHANLKLGAEKCAFAAKEVSYLGHRVTEEGLLPDPALLMAIREIPPPKTATEVRSFLCLAGYYWQYVKNFAAIAGPLHALTRKDAVFHWSTDCQDDLRPSQNTPHYQSHYHLPRLYLVFPFVHGRVNCRPWRNTGTGPQGQGAHHLLCFQVTQPG